MRFALLLDSGALLDLPREKTINAARERVRILKLERAKAKARGDLVTLREVVALVKITHKPWQSKGGEARAAKLSPARRSEIAKKAAKTRWNRSTTANASPASSAQR